MALALMASPAGMAAALRVSALHPLMADLARQVGGERVEVYDLVGEGGNPHRFEPRPSDLKTMRESALVLAGGVVDCAKNFESNDGNGDITDTDVADFFASGPNNTEAEAMLSDPYNQEAPNFAPMSGSPLLTGGMSPSDAFFDAASYRGGVDPANDWTAGWTTSEPN